MGAARYTTSLNAPATNVSWDEVQQFIEKLNKASGKVFRLPTESEWEYACLKGHSDDYRQKINAYSWNAGNSGDSLHEVGLKLPNALGIYDMLGNAYEWCSDAYGKYQSEQKDDSRRMLRGSDFKTRPEIISPKRRNWNQRTKPTERIGFRLAMDK
jgi:formylglycine-generating enzyme required for sulfatase activity